MNKSVRLATLLLKLVNLRRRQIWWVYEGFGRGHFHSPGHNFIIKDSLGTATHAMRTPGGPHNSQSVALVEAKIKFFSEFYSWWDAPVWAHKATGCIFKVENFFRRVYFKTKKMRG